MLFGFSKSVFADLFTCYRDRTVFQTTRRSRRRFLLDPAVIFWIAGRALGCPGDPRAPHALLRDYAFFLCLMKEAASYINSSMMK